MAITTVDKVRPVGPAMLGPQLRAVTATVASGKLTVTAAQLGLATIMGFTGSVNNASTGVGEMVYSTTDLSAPVTSVDLEVISDASDLTAAGQFTGLFWGK